MRRARVSATTAAFLAVLAFLASTVAADDVKFGARVGYYTDVDKAFVGAEVLAPVARHFYFNPNFEYVFVDNGSYWTLNADFHYDFAMDRKSFLWLGGGLGVVRRDFEGPDNGQTDAAANFLAGVGFRTGSVIPYFQAKLVAKSDTAFVVAFGVRF
jgi:hypothetical protein